MKYLIPIIAFIFFQGCASDVYQNLGSNEPKGNVEFRLSSEVNGVSMTMNDSLIVEDEFTKKLRIQNIPTGQQYFSITGPAGNRNEPLNWADSVNVEADKNKTILIDTPAVSSGYWVYVALITLPGIFIFNVN